MLEVETEGELVSALADGQLCGEEFARTVDWLARDEQARLRWHAYHLVGDVLRMGGKVSAAADADFLQTLRLRLQRQAALAPDHNANDQAAGSISVPGTIGPDGAALASSNQARFGAPWALGIASAGVMVLVAWSLLGVWGGSSDMPQLARAPQSAPVLPQLAAGEAPQLMIRDAQLDALLAAHRQFGGTSALQGAAGFLRNATFDGAAR